MNTVAQAKSGERTRFWIAVQTNRSAIITQNLALLIRLVTEQEEVEVLCSMQEVELESHCRLHLRPPPSPESKSFQRNILDRDVITNLFVVIVDMVARLEIAPPEMIRFSDIDWNHHQQLKPRQHCLTHHSGIWLHPPEKSHKFSRGVGRLQQRPRALQVLKHCPHNCRALDSARIR